MVRRGLHCCGIFYEKLRFQMNVSGDSIDLVEVHWKSIQEKVE